MAKPLTRNIHVRSPIVLTRTPFLARFYRYAFHYRVSRTRELFVHVPLQKLFRVYRSTRVSPQLGEFEFRSRNGARRVRFDAMNLQFQALYGRVYECGYEQETAALLDICLQDGGTFFDVGSNWGYFTLYAASSAARVTVHAFEPHPDTFKDLMSCVSQAGLEDIATCHHVALSNSDGEASIEFPDGLHSGSAEVKREGRGVRIITRRLDTLGLPAPSVIKMDVEGHELEALEGAACTLREARPYILFENKRSYNNPGQTLAPLLFLRQQGYSLFVPALKRRLGSDDYFIPCGPQMDLGQIQRIDADDCLSLMPFSAADRFMYQHDLNVFACHSTRLPELESRFAAANSVPARDVE